MSGWRPEEPGSLGEEAARLAAAVEDWARTHAGGGSSAFSSLLGEGIATGAPECRLCPLCQAISAVRGVSPETVEHLLDAVASLTSALRSATAEASAGRRSGRDAGAPGVERIDVQEG